MENEEVSNWVFNKCSVTGSWRAARRSDINVMFNDFNSVKVIKSKDIAVLIELINKTDGNISRMNKLIKK